MKDLGARVATMRKILFSTDLSDIERYDQAMCAICPLELDELPDSISDQIKHVASKMNKIVKQYDIKNFEDYKKMSLTHTKKMRKYALEVFHLLYACVD